MFVLEGHLIKDHPVGVDLGVALWVQDDRLIGSKVRQSDLGALWTHIDQIHHGVVIKVVLADVSNTVHWRERREEAESKQLNEVCFIRKI